MTSWHHMAASVVLLACQAHVLAQNHPGSPQAKASREEAGHTKASAPAPVDPAGPARPAKQIDPAGHGTGPVVRPAREELTHKKAAVGEATHADRGTCRLGAVDCVPPTKHKN